MQITKEEAYFVYGLVKGVSTARKINYHKLDIIVKIKEAYPQIEKDISPEKIIMLLHKLKKYPDVNVFKNITGLFIKGVTC